MGQEQLTIEEMNKLGRPETSACECKTWPCPCECHEPRRDVDMSFSMADLLFPDHKYPGK
jgi:hypothetical protein